MKPSDDLQKESLARAQDLMYDAAEEPSKSKRVKLARQALVISPDCADAYLTLAEDASRDPAEEETYLRQAVEAGERALGEDRFKEYEGMFWGALETRPYMRARAMLADFKSDCGRTDEAIADYWDMLRLNPSDNQGIRDRLYSALLHANKEAELEKLLAEYRESSAFWRYANALLKYRQSGDSPGANTALAAAIQSNEHAPDYLLGRKPMPRYLPDDYILGSEDEGILCSELYREPWTSTEGALDWLRRAVDDVEQRSDADEAEDEGEDDIFEGDISATVLAEHPEFANKLEYEHVEIDGRPVSPRLHLMMHQVIENQLKANEPAETAITLQRLLAAGMGRHNAVHAISSVMAELTFEVMKRRKPFDDQKYIKKLRKLKPW